MNKKAETDMLIFVLIGIILVAIILHFMSISNQLPAKGSNFTGKVGSDYGKVYIHLASTADSGIDLVTLKRIAEDWKPYIKEASYGMIDNLEFVYDPLNADLTKPNIDTSQLGNKIKISYFMTTDNFLTEQEREFYRQFNSNIDWKEGVFAFALYKAQYPMGFTNIPDGFKYSGNCKFSKGSTYIDFCRTNSHELAHAIFMCDDYEGDIMRPTEEYPYTGHFPPNCLKKINYYLPQFSIK